MLQNDGLRPLGVSCSWFGLKIGDNFKWINGISGFVECWEWIFNNPELHLLLFLKKTIN